MNVHFWELQQHEEHPILFIQDEEKCITYGQLREKTNSFYHNCLSDFHKKTMGFILCHNQIETVVGYLAALQSRHAVALLPADLPKSPLNNLIEEYSPEWILGPAAIVNKIAKKHAEVIHFEGNYAFAVRQKNEESQPIHAELAVLLSTSGTTGSPKFVRLSYQNIQENASSIVEYLGLNEQERAITTLPLHYSYGLSVLHSHLLAGASVLLTSNSVMEKPFWSFFSERKATSIAGVPYTYQMLRRLRFERMDLPSLRTLTQAGGRLDIPLQQYFYDISKKTNRSLFMMYGQTEATARMSYVPPESLSRKLGSIGIAIPRGAFLLSQDGELIYKGPNVMMGYAINRTDLSREDDMHEILHTGDIGYKDDEGFYFIHGRKKRFIKLFGLRINLDDVERLIERYCRYSCYCVGNDLKLYIIVDRADLMTQIQDILKTELKLHASAYAVVYMSTIPRLGNGKVDYKALIESVV